MNWPAFKTRAPGKWVLTGEHAVLRGATAIALPHPKFGLAIEFEPGEASDLLRVEPESATQVIHEILEGLREAMDSESLSATLSLPKGTLRIESSIPIGAGLGSSAALCVTIGRWVAGPLKIQETEILKFATALEHRFHGKSSGMDIAVIAVGQPVAFSMEKGPQPLNIKKVPHFTFHDTGLRAQTRGCVAQVEDYRERNPSLGLQKDEAMSLASRLAMEGLIRYDAGDSEQGLKLLQDAMNRAQESFYSWGLVPPEGKRIEAELLQKGALAVKMTGAGGGGMMVALWGNGTSTH